MLNRIGRYYPINSRVHDMNPIIKIICTLLFIVMSFLTYDIKFNILIFVLLIAMLINTEVPIRLYLKSLLSMKWLLVFILLINLIVKTDIIITIITIFRVIFVVMYSSILIFTTSQSEITYGLKVLFSPLKLIGVPVNKMALSISLALRFIPSIIEEGKKIIKSQASRGIDYYNSNYKEKILALKGLVIPMFSITMRKADDLSDIMEVRLYDINGKRTNFRQNKCNFYDIFILIVHISILSLIVKEVIL